MRGLAFPLGLVAAVAALLLVVLAPRRGPVSAHVSAAAPQDRAAGPQPLEPLLLGAIEPSSGARSVEVSAPDEHVGTEEGTDGLLVRVRTRAEAGARRLPSGASRSAWVWATRSHPARRRWCGSPPTRAGWRR